jgi:hypothetical protein
MKWFKDCAGQILKLKQSVEWETPLGLPVIQPYVEIEKVDGALGFHPVPHKQVLFRVVAFVDEGYFARKTHFHQILFIHWTPPI